MGVELGCTWAGGGDINAESGIGNGRGWVVCVSSWNDAGVLCGYLYSSRACHPACSESMGARSGCEEGEQRPRTRLRFYHKELVRQLTVVLCDTEERKRAARNKFAEIKPRDLEVWQGHHRISIILASVGMISQSFLCMRGRLACCNMY